MASPKALEAEIISAIGTATAAGTRVHVGQRLESGALPALIVRITSGPEYVALGQSSGDRLIRADVQISAIADTMSAAGSLVEAAVAKLDTHYSNSDGCVVETQGRTIDDPTSGEGDEAEPYVANQTVTIYERY